MSWELVRYVIGKLRESSPYVQVPLLSLLSCKLI